MLLHTRFNVLETVRIPIAVVGNVVFPSLAMVFFVVPNPAVGGDPVVATAAVGQLTLFSVMSAFLFPFGTGVAEDRALPFDGYVRTLPAGAGPRLALPVLLGRGVVFTVLALLAYRRDEGRRFHSGAHVPEVPTGARTARLPWACPL